MKDCVFCHIESDKIEYSNDLVFIISDGFPVSEGHRLIIPRRHVSSAIDLSIDEQAAIFSQFKRISKEIQKQDASVEGFNCGFNIGEVAGQTVFHAHFHVIPRRKGDNPEPRGGVRNVISGKGSY